MLGHSRPGRRHRQRTPHHCRTVRSRQHRLRGGQGTPSRASLSTYASPHEHGNGEPRTPTHLSSAPLHATAQLRPLALPFNGRARDALQSPPAGTAARGGGRLPPSDWVPALANRSPLTARPLGERRRLVSFNPASSAASLAGWLTGHRAACGAPSSCCVGAAAWRSSAALSLSLRLSGRK